MYIYIYRDLYLFLSIPKINMGTYVYLYRSISIPIYS